MLSTNLDKIVSEIEKNYEADEIFFTKPCRRFPNREALIRVIKEIRRLFFPGYFGTESLSGQASPRYFIGERLIEIERTLHAQLIDAFRYEEGCAALTGEIEQHATEVCAHFIDKLPEIQRILLTDVQAALDGDPAASSKEEIIFSYPGPFAIFVYRLAHVLYEEKVPFIPRIMTEYAHGGTGIDINAGAEIGPYFFIDHGTGIVIGETTTIGSHVKLYQGVTLGALSTRGGQQLRGVKRHPTIGDNVTIYSNACVLGGDTVVGSNSIIGGSVFVTESIPPHSRVSFVGQELNISTRTEADPVIFEL